MILEATATEVSGADYIATYHQYLQDCKVSMHPDLCSQVDQILATTHWEEPQSGADWNNCGVVALIEASNSQDLTEREVYLEMAISAFEQGAELHPLCQAHLALAHALLAESNKALQLAFSYLLWLIQLEHQTDRSELPAALIYIPPSHQPPANNQAQLLSQLLSANGYQQCLGLLSEVLLLSQMVFYNSMGLRLLHLAVHLLPNLASVNLRLGISSLSNGQREGMLYLHRAAQQAPQDYGLCTALSVAYQDGGQLAIAQTWQAQAQSHLNTLLPSDNPQRRYVPFDRLWIAVEASFRSIVTAVLIAEGDWFEHEMEYWRTQIQPGMVVIDVGANVGVYTFSAAQRVGVKGKVIAIEPFSGCVGHLEATCHINHLEQVKVYRGAASDQEGQIYLSLSAASELNEVVTDPDKAKNGNYEEAPCFTLDSVCGKENLSKVDFLKIDAEGHELQVLMGSQQLIERFSPVILYENIAGSQGSNIEVAEYLQKIGYQLFRYQPYLQQLVPVEIATDFQGSLNLIAMRSV